MAIEGAVPVRFQEVFADGSQPRERMRDLAEEAPVAIEINGVAYAVMMATPTDLADYALGFCLSEGLIEQSQQMLGVEAAPVEAGGWVLRIQLSAPCAEPLLERARLRLSEGSCGLCGIESLEQVLRPLPQVTARLDVPPQAVFRAVSELGAQQPLGRVTRASHAAALCAPDGAIRLVREDVGRHNALDKLLGAAARERLCVPEYFILLTARCSFELVQKAVMANCALLVTISAASTLAVQQAQRHGLRLASLARGDSYLVPLDD